MGSEVELGCVFVEQQREFVEAFVEAGEDLRRRRGGEQLVDQRGDPLQACTYGGAQAFAPARGIEVAEQSQYLEGEFAARDRDGVGDRSLHGFWRTMDTAT